MRENPTARAMIACLLALAISAASIGGCKSKPGPPAPKKYSWLILNHTSYEHIIHVDVNGKRYKSFDKEGSGVTTVASPLHDGRNRILVTFIPRPGKKPAFGSSLKIILSPSMASGTGFLPGLECDVDEGHCEFDVEIHMAAGVPGLMRYTRRDWLDAARERCIYEERVETDMFEKVWDQVWERSWSDDGRLLWETHYLKDKLATARIWKPDGSLGAEIRNGKGVWPEYHDSGKLRSETPYADGLPNGDEKEYYESGRLARVVQVKDGRPEGECVFYDENGRARVRGTYHKGKRHGAWRRYDEQGRQVARGVFEDGELTEGQDRFEEFAERP